MSKELLEQCASQFKYFDVDVQKWCRENMGDGHTTTIHDFVAWMRNRSRYMAEIIEIELAKPEQDYIKKLEDDFREQLDQLSERNYKLRMELADAKLAQPEQAEKQELAVQHLWECIGRWSSYLAVNGTQANMAPPNWLLDAVKAATSQPRKPWVGLTDEQLSETYNDLYTQYTRDDVNIVDFILIARTIESQLKELNT